MTGNPRDRIESNLASLIGGIIVGAAVFSLWCVIARELDLLSPVVVIVGAMLGVASATWIRLANL